MTAKTPAERNASYRRRMAEKMERMREALEEIHRVDVWGDSAAFAMKNIARDALNPHPMTAQETQSAKA